MPIDTVFTVDGLAERLGAERLGPGSIEIRGLNTLEFAEPGDMTFIGSGRYAKRWHESRASAALVTLGIDVPQHDSRSRALLYVRNADLAMAELLRLFGPPPSDDPQGVSSAAFVHPTARIDPTATILPGAVVGARATVGPRTILEHHVVIGPDSTVGSDCHLRAGVVIRERCKLGNRVSIHPNTVVGSDGFGYRPDGHGGITKIPHIGNVIIEDDVEIGACSTIDRGKFGPTIIGPHTKLDNLVQIAHNSRIGRGCVIAAQSATSGSTVLGDFVQMGGQSGVSDHVRVATRTRIAAQSGVMRHTQEGQTLCGSPAVEFAAFWRHQVVLDKLPGLLRELSNAADHGPGDDHDDDPSPDSG